MNLSEKVKAVINSDASAYKIEQLTGVSSSIILRLRNHTRSIDHLSLGTAEKLEKYYDYRLAHLLKGTNHDPHLSYFRHRLTNLLQELYEAQETHDRKNQLLNDDDAMTAVIEQLFDDILDDAAEIQKLKKIYDQLVTQDPKLTF
ncbi:hypothetical protein [Lentilactobacillus farraginis]|uniref:Uncharacterized protein n=1 Tax=Lentilactobacillus farraginis DSM 18382 = JCM 14108 TaxID=1423743 RepID=X0P9B8_9LACO|nr:hypothetical protein [Lentilactobacillus farraginis]KRM11621.1 hypothetical protein FD41_GL001254 [Lentilactobacillus farraginis DSM 18382 = JCM 14108]GAF35338.1 hypothetical protein JCM14108_221 [Lentilactobacillus farraginis DSM 18382 = JCM 14108]